MRVTEKCGSKHQKNQLGFLNGDHWGTEGRDKGAGDCGPGELSDS